jgi:hypothetical protein
MELGIAGRRARVDRDESRQRVGPVDSPLRSAQHFDAVHVGQRGGHADSREIHAIDEETHRRIGSALPLLELADAAQLEEARPRRSGRPVQVGYEAEEVLKVLHSGECDRAGIEHGRARGQVSQLAIAQVRRDDDFIER